MEHEVRIITGPPSDRIKKEEAVAKLTSHPQFPKNASFNIENVEGRWIAAVAVPTQIEKVSAPPMDGPPMDGPPSDGPSGPPSDDAGLPPELEAPADEDAPKDEEKGEKGLEAEVKHLTELLTKVVDALGLGEHDDSPVPGPDEPHDPGAEGPHPHGDDKTHTVHERAMKPGEAPPGATPIGSPAFASVADDHPWKDIIGQKRTFTVEEEIGDQSLSDVHSELQTLASGTGYKVQQLREASSEGRRTAKALLQRVA